VPKKIRELKAILRKAGFSFRKGKGSHTVWSHAQLSAREDAIVLSGNDGDDAKPYQERDVERALKKLQGEK
jgi:predicted RNA binding protein YcfA (HicA-like mRNA interferase family)